jgi:hypothetical protein
VQNMSHNRAAEKLARKSIPDASGKPSVILGVNAGLKIPADAWLPANRSTTIKKIADALSRVGELTKIAMTQALSGIGRSSTQNCAVCGWIHDAGFTQIQIGEGDAIFLRGAASAIALLIHQAHERGLPALSTKDEDLLEVCRGYHHPCKAFDDLNRRGEYKRLFDTSRRGFISLRGTLGRNRNQPQPRPE